jgi:hypothetical protein
MGNSAGPKITKDGLVLDFDAANPKSYNFYADSYASNVSLYLQMNGANGSTTFTDSSPNALAVTAVGNAQISTTQSKYNGTSAYFDGTGDYLSIAANSAIDLGSGDFTIEFWVRPAAKTNAVDAVFGYGNYACMFYHNGTNWTLEMSSTGSSNQLVITCAVTLNTWQHIAIVRNGSSIVVYKDGVSSATGTFTGTVTTNARTLRIGDNGNSQNINGYIDELKITKGVARYTSAFTSPPIPSTCTDLTRSKNVGTLTGGVDYNFSNGGSLVFDGTNDYITSPTSTLFNFGTGDFTIEMWVYPTSVKTFSLLDFRINETNPNGNAFVIGTSASNFWVVYQNGNQITGPTVVANQWVQLVVNRVGTAVKMFLNGVQAGSTWTTSNTFTDGAFVLGTDYPLNARFFQGNVSSVKIYKAKGLTSTEVYNNFVANRGRFGV